MKRLTYFDGGKWRLKIGDTEYSGEVADRLAAYEDTGLEPEEVRSQKELFDYLVFDSTPSEDIERFNRLRELAQAHKENRVLPEGSGWFVTCSGKKLTVVMDIEAALRRKQDG